MRFGIPTSYGGTRFRSRLEARWAAFFDLMGWEWEYEPADLNGWIPDFSLRTSPTVYVEVKPTKVFLEDVAAKMVRGLPGEEARNSIELLLLGDTAPLPPRGMSAELGSQIGWLRALPMSWHPEQTPTWGPAIVQKFEDDGLRWDAEASDFVARPRLWTWGLYSGLDAHMRIDPGCEVKPDVDIRDLAWNRIGTTQFGNLVPDGTRHFSGDLIQYTWRQAGNRVQWMGPKPINEVLAEWKRDPDQRRGIPNQGYHA